MQQRRHPGEEEFSDWDNPEDWEEEAPEGYYDEEEPGESDPDYDLSEAYGYADWEPNREEIIPRWLIAGASILLIIAILVPLLIRIS